MAVVVDASSPAVVHGLGPNSGTTGSITTASFTPPASALLVAVSLTGGYSGDPGATLAMTDSLSGSWTNRVSQTTYTSGGFFVPGTVHISTRVIGSSAAMTVTSSWTAGSGGTIIGRMLAVYVLTGADGTTFGNNVTNYFTNTATFSSSLTTTVAGSLPVGGYMGQFDAVFSLRANTSWPSATGTNPFNTTDTTGGGSVAYALAEARATSVTGTPGATTFGVNAPSGSFGKAALLEIVPLTNQNIAGADSSSPAADSAAVHANIAGADTGSGADTAAVSTAISAADTGTATEAVPKITLLAAETAAGDEATKVLSGGAILAFASDVAASAEATALSMKTTDAMAYLEASIVAIQGPLPPGPRIVRVLPDDVTSE